MNRSNIIKKLVKEGMSEKTLANFSDKQIMVLASRMLSEAVTKNVQQTTMPQSEFDAKIKTTGIKGGTIKQDPVSKNVTITANEVEERGKKKLSKKQSQKMDTDKDGDIDGEDLKTLRSKKLKENFGNPKYHEYEDAPEDDVDYGDGPKYSVDDFDDFQPEDDNTSELGREKILHRIYRSMNTGLGRTKSNVYTMKPDDVRQFPPSSDMVSEARKKPSAGLSAKKKSSVVKAAKAGKDIGKKGAGFKMIEKKAKESGAKNPKAVAAAAMWKNIKREGHEVNNWLKALVETEYHPFTSKGEIMELIQSKLDERGGRNMVDNDLPDFLSYDAIVNAEPAVAPVTKPEKPKVEPSRPTRERPNERPKPFNPYQPGPGTNPKPKMRK